MVLPTMVAAMIVWYTANHHARRYRFDAQKAA